MKFFPFLLGFRLVKWWKSQVEHFLGATSSFSCKLSWIYFLPVLLGFVPCILPANQRFELTNHDSAGGKNFTVLTSMYVNRKGIEVGLLISLETTLNIHEKGFTVPKTISASKK